MLDNGLLEPYARIGDRAYGSKRGIAWEGLPIPDKYNNIVS